MSPQPRSHGATPLPAARPEPGAAPHDAAALDASCQAIDRTHRDAQRTLQAFDRLLAHLDEQGLDIDAEAAAAEVLAFFDAPASQHHRDEEAQVFPGLLADGDAVLVRQIQRLQQEHGWIEDKWRLLKPQLEAVAAGYNAYDLALLREALPVFAALYQAHIALEEQVVVPAARALRGLPGD